MQRPRSFPLVAPALALAASLAVFGACPARAQLAPLAVKPALSPTYEHFDLRDKALAHDAVSTTARANYHKQQLTATRQSLVAASRLDMQTARTTLKAAVPGLQLEPGRVSPVPEAVGTTGHREFLTGSSTRPREEILRGFLADHAAVYGVTAAETGKLVQTSEYTNPAGNLSFVGLRQEINGLPVFQGEIHAAFTAKGALARTTGSLASGLDATGLPPATTAALNPAQATVHGAAAIGRALDARRLTLNSSEAGGRVGFVVGGPFSRETKTELMYFPVEPGVAALAYAMVLWDKPVAYYVVVDANDGTLLFRKCITQDETMPAAYGVYTGDSPSPLSPTTVLPGQGTQAPGVGRTQVVTFSDDATASPNGWLNDSASPVVTTGNNCDAGLDAVSPDGIESYGRATGTLGTVTYNGTATNGYTFNFSYNPPPLGTDAATSYVSGTTTITPYGSGAVTNLFFWTNRYHDRLYNLGFTEAALNFQTTNTFTINGTTTNRGGVAGDPVLAQVHDYSGTNNANFSTPPDGTSGVMQMYLFPSPTPARDGSLDGDVFLHEMTHGLSSRLHANGTGLAINQAAGMGEGWSDFYARCILSTADEDVDGVYASGGYVTYLLGNSTSNYYYGIRRFPYAVISKLGANGKPHNPETFADVDPSQINLSDGAYAPNPIFGTGTATEVHNMGEVWCSMLLEVRERIIKRLGYAVGNQRVLQIVTDAMKLDVPSPTMIQARDSIIAADNSGYGGADAADIRAGFAVRGMGLNATTNGTNVTESYSPFLMIGTVAISDPLGNGNGYPEPGEDVTINVPFTNVNATVAQAATATVGIYTASGNIPANGASTLTIPYRIPATAALGSIQTVTVSFADAYGPGTRTLTYVVGKPVFLINETFDGVMAPALPAGWTTTRAAASGGVVGTFWTTVANAGVDTGNAAYSPDISGNGTAGGEASLVVSPTQALPNGGPARLSFKHAFGFEQSSGYNWDGGVLEINIAGGGFTDIVTAGGAFVTNGYNGTLYAQAANPIGGRTAFCGLSSGVLTSLVTLPTNALGKTVQLRWREGFDNAVGGGGWLVDSVQLVGNYTADPIDTDGDGIQNGYETAHGLNPNDATDAALDADGDGQTNLQEYLAGTDPQSASSMLKVAQTTLDPAGALTLVFPTVQGKVYGLQYKTALTDAAWTDLTTTYNGTGGDLTVKLTATDLSNPVKQFFRVTVRSQ